MLKKLTNTIERLRGRSPTDAAAIVLIRQFYADRALISGGNDLRDFLRALNAAHDADALWDIRAEFYTLISHTHGEYRAMEDTKQLHLLFAPLVARGKVRAARRSTRSGAGSSNQTGGPISSGFNLSTQSFMRVQSERVAAFARASEDALKPSAEIPPSSPGVSAKRSAQDELPTQPQRR